MKLLYIDSSITGEASASRKLSSAIVSVLTHAAPNIEVVRRDLDSEPLPHLDSRLVAAAGPNGPADEATRAAAEESARVLDEFLGADVVVIGAPMYNFTVPSQLKAWVDRILIAGKTFRYTEKGPEGLAGGKRVIVASSRGGSYGAGSPAAPFDFQETYLRAALGFIGIDTIEFVRAEGLAMGADQRDASIRAALNLVPKLAPSLIRARAA
jgi:FMN-dependent NADH-azoreductase